MLPMRTEVLVVGAGPTGLALAAALVRRGVECLAVDRLAEGANTSRAAVIHSNTLEVLEPLGVSARLTAQGHKVPRFSVRARDRTLLTVRFDGLPTRYPGTIMLPQDATEAILLDRLQELGGRVHRPWRVVDLAEDAEGVDAILLAPDGATRRLRADYVVGADGMHSIVRHAARIPFDGSTYEQSFLLADVAMEWGLPADEVCLFFSPQGFVVVAPLPGGRHRIVATMDEAPPEPALGDLQAILDARGPRGTARARLREIVWGSRFRVHHRLATRYRAGRLLLAGDAAHVHSPAGGQGMNTGLVDACVLADRLADVVAGRRDHRALDEYELLRRPVAERVLALSNRMTRMATLRHGALRSLRDLGMRMLGRSSAFRHALAMDLSGLSHRVAGSNTRR